MNINPDPSQFYTKPLTNTELYYLGIPKNNLEPIDTLENLRLQPPNIIIAQAKENVTFLQNNSRPQSFKKKREYVMGLGIYMQLHFDLKQHKEILKPSQNLKFKKVYKPYKGQDLTNKKLLVFRTGGIGDLIFIAPNLQYLKEKYPTCKIVFACNPQYYSMVKEWKFIDEILDLPFDKKHLISADYHVIFEGIIERCEEAKTVNAYHLFTEWFGLNLPNELLIPKQKPNSEKISKCIDILEKWNIENFIIVQIRSSSVVRSPRHEIWKKIIDKLTADGHNDVITDSKHASNLIDFFIDSLENKEKVFNFSQHSVEISDTIALASMADLAIGVDSSLNHIAISVGTKTFGIFGPFLGELRFSTYPKDLCDWVDVKRECAPCFLHGVQACDQSIEGFSPCYNNIDYDECFEKIEKLLKG